MTPETIAPRGVNLLTPQWIQKIGAAKITPMGYRATAPSKPVEVVNFQYHTGQHWIITLSLN